MPRIWLDATVDLDDFDLVPTPQWRPPVPSIPEEQNYPPQTPVVPLRRRRRSMPPPVTRHEGARKKKSARQKNAPDVISTLVDSLATISSPADDHFDAIPSINGIGLQPPHQGGHTLRRVRSTEDRLRSSDLHSRFGQISGGSIDDAAIPPVIKTAPPPSGFSPITAPKIPKESPARTHFFKTGSKTSLNSQRSGEIGSTMGNPSLDSIVMGQSERNDDDVAEPPTIPTGGGRRERHRSLFTPSQERMRELYADQKRATVSLGEDAMNLLNIPRSRHRSTSPKKSRHAFDPPLEELEFEARMSEAFGGTKASGKRPVRKPVISTTAASPDVPKRQSSLLHTDGSSFASSSKSRRRSNRSEVTSNRSTSNQSEQRRHSKREPSTTSEPVVEPILEPAAVELVVEEPVIEEPVMEEAFKLEDVEDIDTEVVKRIKELKARKELREKEALERLQPPDSSRPIRSPSTRHGRSASDPSSPFPNEDSKMLLAHKPSILAKRASTNDIAERRGLAVDGQADTRPITPLTPLEATSLPINYNYVLQTLERATLEQRAERPTTSRASSKAPSGKIRPKSLGVGARSEAARQRAVSAIEKEKDSMSLRAQSPPRRASIGVRANSEEQPVRYRPPEESQNRFTLDPVPAPTRTSSKKKVKRWSHPDLPLRAELEGPPKLSRRVRDSEPLAVRPPEPPTPVPEEPVRPSTSDSIDDDIKSFIHAPRLTQKIRHPETGRTIAFSEVGDPKGHVVFCCVGMGLTRYVTAFYDELAATLKLRLITPDRPGVGESQTDTGGGNPLNWPDDVMAICSALHIPKFSILAHSAGAIYALATALRIPQHIRGKVHLLAPWIPPSQMTSIGLPQGAAGKAEQPPGMGQLPKSQRLLRVLPTPFLKVANSGFMTATSASLSPKTAGTPTKSKRSKTWKADSPSGGGLAHSRHPSSTLRPGIQHTRRESIMLMDQNVMPSGSALSLGSSHGKRDDDPRLLAAMTLAEQERRREYDARLTLSIWSLATTNANPAVDLLVCLERTQPIGFRYVDINKQVVIHHGSRDTRVPVDNVKWLGRTMRRCEVRILEGEGHGLMASAGVMGSVLTEMAREWEEWDRAVKERKVEKKERVQVNGHGNHRVDSSRDGYRVR
ncbi:alpha/beta-hydrolase [Rhizodiscina lignyota]|uniref:Alpha/beta-hydrolase n=1 Tax=Rhizodiscina lignyota TaxID=1504668 RepID=A0A9P4IPT2_9PEZI|nr:alpha/beta-hydrolase [Rhizodiscina lignyota]